jgi:hypothetical protein
MRRSVDAARYLHLGGGVTVLAVHGGSRAVRIVADAGVAHRAGEPKPTVNGLRILLGVDEQRLAASGIAHDTHDELVVAVTRDTRVLRSERRGRAPNGEDDDGDPADQRRAVPLTSCSSAGIGYGAAPATGGRSHIVPTTPTEPSMREFRHGSPPPVRIALRSD